MYAHGGKGFDIIKKKYKSTLVNYYFPLIIPACFPIAKTNPKIINKDVNPNRVVSVAVRLVAEAICSAMTGIKVTTKTTSTTIPATLMLPFVESRNLFKSFLIVNTIIEHTIYKFIYFLNRMCAIVDIRIKIIIYP